MSWCAMCRQLDTRCTRGVLILCFFQDGSILAGCCWLSNAHALSGSVGCVHTHALLIGHMHSGHIHANYMRWTYLTHNNTGIEQEDLCESMGCAEDELQALADTADCSILLHGFSETTPPVIVIQNVLGHWLAKLLCSCFDVLGACMAVAQR